MLELYRKICSAPYNDKESILEAEAVLGEIYILGAITWGEYNELLGKYYE